MKKKAVFQEKRCAKCGELFLPTTGVAKYCPECRKLVLRENSVRFRENQKIREQDTVCCICGGKFGEMIGGKPYCHKHRRRFRKYGTFDLPKKKSTSVFGIEGDILKITTLKGDVILADAEDYDLLKGYSWYITSHGYAAAIKDGEQIYMHRLVMGEYLGNESEIDHEAGRKIDNRKKKLRTCAHRQNAKNMGVFKNNTSGYPGVFNRGDGRFRATITVDYRNISLGAYDSFEEAVLARIKGEDKYHGEFAGHIRRRKERDEMIE